MFINSLCYFCEFFLDLFTNVCELSDVNSLIGFKLVNVILKKICMQNLDEVSVRKISNKLNDTERHFFLKCQASRRTKSIECVKRIPRVKFKQNRSSLN